MFPATWRSKRLCFSPFEYSDAKLVKALFEQNQHLQYQDPTFKPWSLSTYQALIADSAEKKEHRCRRGVLSSSHSNP